MLEFFETTVFTIIYMLLAYSKGEREDLSPSQKRMIKQLVAEEFR